MNYGLKNKLWAIGLTLLFCFTEISAQSSEQPKTDDKKTSLKLARKHYLKGDYSKTYQAYLTHYNEFKTLTKRDWVRFRGAALLLGDKEVNKVNSLIKPFSDTEFFKDILLGVDVNIGDFKMHRLGWNTQEYEEFAPILIEDKLFFVSSQPNVNMDLGKYDVNQQAFYDVFWVDSSGTISNANNFLHGTSANSINSHFHDGPLTSTDSLEKFILNRNADIGNGLIGMALFESNKKGNSMSYSKWKRIDKLSRNCNHQHPFFDRQSATLYFSSDMPGGHGGFDLYAMKLEEEGWSEPVNLGSKVNTAGDEVFPTVWSDNLYFSSNGYESTGNLDLFVHNQFGTFELEDFNSVWDDYHALFITDTTGYFCSNRFNGYGTDDIYGFKYLSGPQKKEIKFVFDHITSDTILTKVKLSFNGMDTIIEVLGGSFSMEFLGNDNLDIEVSFESEGFFPKTERLNLDLTSSKQVNLNADKLPEKFPPIVVMKLREETGESITKDCDVSVSYSFDGTEFNGENWLVSNGYFTKVLTDAKDKSFLWMKYDLVLKGFLKVSDSIRLNIEDLDTIYLHEFSPKIIHLERIKKGLDIGKYYKVGMIYFDVNKFNIRPDAAIELNKIIKALNENPEISIELGSHTDCRGSSKSNQILSQKRAKSSAQYIISKGGIAAERLSYKGYGESQIINGCVDGVTCSDEEHAVNRRTEFKITDTEIN